MLSLEQRLLEHPRQLWWKFQDFKADKIKALNQWFIGHLTDEQILRLSRPYIAGYNQEEGLHTVLSYVNRGRKITIDDLGESSLTMGEADTVVQEYIRFIDWISANKLQKEVSISLKATSICPVISKDIPALRDPESLIPRLELIVKYASERGVDVTLDMEGSASTQISLNAAKYIWKQGYENFGMVLQTMLNRTRDDIIDLFVKTEYPIQKKKMRVRVVRGIYDESRDIATQSKSEAKHRMIDITALLLDIGIYVEIGTHDKKYFRKIMERVIKPRLESDQITKDDFEFQVLMGVHNGYVIGDRLLGEGFAVRWYAPIQARDKSGVPYMRRRLRANPSFVFSGAKNKMQGWMHSAQNSFHQWENDVGYRRPNSN